MAGIAGGALFTGLIGTLGARFVWENGMHYALFTLLKIDVGDVPQGPITPDLEWPTWIIYAAIPLGSYLMCFRFMQVGWSFFRTGELPHHDHSVVDGIDEIVDATEALEEYEEHRFDKPAKDGGAK
jgi:C4-dicarboxylate transporter DctQ subunit